jgi:hypothetical protein
VIELSRLKGGGDTKICELELGLMKGWAVMEIPNTATHQPK